MISTDIIDDIINTDTTSMASTSRFFDFLKLEEDPSSLEYPCNDSILVHDAISGDDKFLDSIINSLLNNNNEENSIENVIELGNLFDESSLDNPAISVLGVDLNLNTDCLDQTVNDLTLNEKVNDYFFNGPTNDFPFLMDSPAIYQEHPDIVSMFPHMNDEKNRRRRNFLYESNTLPSPTVTTIKNDKKFDKLYFKKRDHDYTQKFIADNEKYFTCPIMNCDKIYAKSSHLKAHLRRHSGEKPFVCNWKNCTWKFSRSDELARHKRSHSGIKPYKCEICDKAFARSDHLSKHKKIHKKKMAQGGNYFVGAKSR